MHGDPFGRAVPHFEVPVPSSRHCDAPAPRSEHEPLGGSWAGSQVAPVPWSVWHVPPSPSQYVVFTHSDADVQPPPAATVPFTAPKHFSQLFLYSAAGAFVHVMLRAAV